MRIKISLLILLAFLGIQLFGQTTVTGDQLKAKVGLTVQGTSITGFTLDTSQFADNSKVPTSLAVKKYVAGHSINLSNSNLVLTGERTLDGNRNNLYLNNFPALRLSTSTGTGSYGGIQLVDLYNGVSYYGLSGEASLLSMANKSLTIAQGFYGSTDTSYNSKIRLYKDSIQIYPQKGNLFIDTLYNNTSSNKLLGWQSTSPGFTGYINVGNGLNLSSGTLFVKPDTLTDYRFKIPAPLTFFNGSVYSSPTPVLSAAYTGFWAYKNLTGASWTNGVATFSVGSAHNLNVGNIVLISGASPSGYNTTGIVTAIPNSTSFSLKITSNPGTYTSGGNVTCEPAVQLAMNQIATPALFVSAHPSSVSSGLDAYPYMVVYTGGDGNPQNYSWGLGVDGHSVSIRSGGYLKSFENGPVSYYTGDHLIGFANSSTADPSTSSNIDLLLSRVRANWLAVGGVASGGDSTGGITAKNAIIGTLKVNTASSFTNSFRINGTPTFESQASIGATVDIYGSGVRIAMQNQNGTIYQVGQYAAADEFSIGLASQTPVLTMNQTQLGIGSTTHHSSAIVDITSTTKGLLPPRMTNAQKGAISSPATGLTVYCTDCTASDASTGVMQTYNGSTWKNYW